MSVVLQDSVVKLKKSKKKAMKRANIRIGKKEIIVDRAIIIALSTYLP